jgi:NhaP-type Na+/H+ or K+/H+ antiporter
MSAGPLRRTTAGLGLVGLVPIALLLATGAITPEEAAMRAVAVAVAVVVVGRVAHAILTRLLRRMERRGRGADARHEGPHVRHEHST